MKIVDYVSFNQAFISEPVGKLKIKESEYDPSGSISVVDQGQKLVSGRTNRIDLTRENTPYIVFGDHTRVVKFIDFPFVVGADGVRLFKAADNFDPEYLYLFLNCVQLPVDGYGRHSKYLKKIQVPIVGLGEQRRIAAWLKTQLAEVEKARKAAEARLHNVQLLEMKTIETIFSELDTVLKAKIGDVAQTTSGSTPARGQINYWKPAETPWVKTAEVAFAPITSTEESISRKALQECSLTLLPPKTVLVAMYGQGKTRGQSAILEVPATTNQACFAILPNETLKPEFLYYWLKRSYLDLRTLSEDRGGNQANLNGALLKAFEVPSPEKSVQIKIVEKVGLALEEINLVYENCNRTLADIQQIPNRLLSKAFEMN